MPDPRQPPGRPDGFTIGWREIWTELRTLTRVLDETRGEVRGRLDLLDQSMHTAARTDDDHERRLRTLEKGRWPLPSVGLVFSAAAVVIAALALFR